MTFRDYINEGLLNKIKNYTAEDIEVGRIIYFGKDGAMPSDVNEVIQYNKSEDVVKIRNVDTDKVKEMSIKEFFKLGPTNLDWIGRDKGSGLIAYNFWKEIKTKDLLVTLNSDAKFEIKETEGIIKPKIEVQIKVKKQKIKSFTEAEGEYKDEVVIFNPNDIKKF